MLLEDPLLGVVVEHDIGLSVLKRSGVLSYSVKALTSVGLGVVVIVAAVSSQLLILLIDLLIDVVALPNKHIHLLTVLLTVLLTILLDHVSHSTSILIPVLVHDFTGLKSLSPIFEKAHRLNQSFRLNFLVRKQRSRHVLGQSHGMLKLWLMEARGTEC